MTLWAPGFWRVWRGFGVSSGGQEGPVGGSTGAAPGPQVSVARVSKFGGGGARPSGGGGGRAKRQVWLGLPPAGVSAFTVRGRHREALSIPYLPLAVAQHLLWGGGIGRGREERREGGLGGGGKCDGYQRDCRTTSLRHSTASTARRCFSPSLPTAPLPRPCSGLPFLAAPHIAPTVAPRARARPIKRFASAERSAAHRHRRQPRRAPPPPHPRTRCWLLFADGRPTTAFEGLLHGPPL